MSYTFGKLFACWGLSSVKLSAGFAEVAFSPSNDDQEAAWEMYVELITRITTQPLPDEHGDEESALNSVYALFGITREIMKNRGRNAPNFSKIAIVVLNQIIRPFTAKWHRMKNEGAFQDAEKCKVFREELKGLQIQLTGYARMLADIAKVEDLTALV